MISGSGIFLALAVHPTLLLAFRSIQTDHSFEYLQLTGKSIPRAGSTEYSAGLHVAHHRVPSPLSPVDSKSMTTQSSAPCNRCLDTTHTMPITRRLFSTSSPYLDFTTLFTPIPYLFHFYLVFRCYIPTIRTPLIRPTPSNQSGSQRLEPVRSVSPLAL